MDHGFYDLTATRSRHGRTVELTSAADVRGSAVVELSAGQCLKTHPGHRTDVFVLEGVLVHGARARMEAGGFLGMYDEQVLTAAETGAVLLVYREPATSPGTPVSLPATEQLWRDGVHMDVALLAAEPHRVALIRWAPQTYVPPHSNPGGEELFVLYGELRVNGRDLPRGSWLRLAAGERHDSGADRATLILLRSGHLP